jgi:mannosyltransferase
MRAIGYPITILVGITCVIVSYLINGRWQDQNKPNQPMHTIYDLTYWPDAPLDHKNRTQIGQEKATLFMLVRNFEVQEALESMRQIEDRFNRNYRYPWTFLNDDDFTDEVRLIVLLATTGLLISQFISLTKGLASGHVYYGKVPHEHWSIPDHVDRDRLNQSMAAMEEKKIIYGGSLSYRHMCRFNSGFFFRHPLLEDYEWYWRVEPGVTYYCDQRYDPFTFMKNNNKIYGFVITIYEYVDTIPTLWRTAEQFFKQNPEYVAPNNALDFITDKKTLRRGDLVLDTNSDYNLCHFWSNFEIANLDFFRSERYVKFFEHLDKSGGFFYERWGDAPVHTIGLAAMLNKTQIHHFADIGYKYVFVHPHAMYRGWSHLAWAIRMSLLLPGGSVPQTLCDSLRSGLRMSPMMLF